MKKIFKLLFRQDRLRVLIELIVFQAN